jgi:hypothetical protein
MAWLKTQDKDAVIWLAYDEEGNAYGPLIYHEGVAVVDPTGTGKRTAIEDWNVGLEKGMVILYPASGFEQEFEDAVLSTSEEHS